MTELPANFRGDRRLDHVNHHEQPTWRFAMAGLCASLVGLGLARFAYTPLIPALITAKWFSASDVVYLGAANLAGYLAGALLARPIAARLGSTWALRAMMTLATLSCFACSVPVSFVWFFVWRFLAGATGGTIMVLAASVVLPHTSPAKRGIVGGVIFAGVGLGVAASGTLVPLLLQQGLRESWYGLGALSALLTLISWTSWPKVGQPPKPPAVAHHQIHRGQSKTTWALLLEYGLNACALVPHMVFLVDFVARGLGQGIATGSNYWVFFGLGAIVGPLLTGHIADRTGFGPALRASSCSSGRTLYLFRHQSSPASLISIDIVISSSAPASCGISTRPWLVPRRRLNSGAAVWTTPPPVLRCSRPPLSASSLFAQTILLSSGSAASPSRWRCAIELVVAAEQVAEGAPWRSRPFRRDQVVADLVAP